MAFAEVSRNRCRIDREQAAEHHRLHGLEAGQWFESRAVLFASVMVSPTRVSRHLLDAVR